MRMPLALIGCLVVDALTGKAVLQQEGKAYMFSSPAIAGEVVFIGVTNGTLDARDLASGKLLWDFQTEASKQNAGWVLTTDRKFNNSLLFRSGAQWQGPPSTRRTGCCASARSSRRHWSQAA